MPLKIVDEQKHYQFTLDTLAPGGLPTAEVMTLGGVHYIACCPGCGCIHELPRTAQDGGQFEPRCLLPITHKAAYENWLSTHPEAADYRTVTLRYRKANITSLSDTPKAAPKPARRAKRKAAA